MPPPNIIAAYTRMPHYQAYYWMGLSALLPLRVAGGPWWYRCLPKADLSLDLEQACEGVRKRVGLKSSWDASAVDQFAGGYILNLGDQQIRFAIDAHDGREIFSPALLDSCDRYFKANMWRNVDYPDKVLPLVNGNGFLRKRHLQRLRALRKSEKSIDFLFISRIWGGVEHNIRLFEALAALPFNKRLVAIFVEGAAEEKETEAAIRRLQKVGVSCTFDLMPAQDLWEQVAAARVVMLRAGKYLCIPWRMIDLLCLGACIVTDADFEPQWPVPLVEGEHYISGGIERPADTSAAEKSEYAQLGEVVANLLKDNERMLFLQRNVIDYFDRHAAPEQVGKYIFNTLTS